MRVQSLEAWCLSSRRGVEQASITIMTGATLCRWVRLLVWPLHSTRPSEVHLAHTPGRAGLCSEGRGGRRGSRIEGRGGRGIAIVRRTGEGR